MSSSLPATPASPLTGLPLRPREEVVASELAEPAAAGMFFFDLVWGLEVKITFYWFLDPNRNIVIVIIILIVIIIVTHNIVITYLL